MALATGTIIHNRYRIVKLLGQGGFGAVYRGWDINLHRPCAIKENLDTSPEARRQFQREATTLANLAHPNLPRVTDHFILPGQGQYLVMDFVEGEDLESLLARQGSVVPQQALNWIVQVADALEYLHGQTPPIIHRDLKPANIILTPDGRVMLVDFGLVKLYDPQLRTTHGARAVTPGYSPPEQYGHGNTDARTDLYALAATLYTLLTGQEPQESVQRIVQDALAPAEQLNPQVPPEVGQAIRRAMSLTPSQRYPTVEAFKHGLVQEKTTVLPPASSSSPSPSPAPDSIPGTASTPVPASPFLGRWGLIGGALLLVLLTACILNFTVWPMMRGREANATATAEAELAALNAQSTSTAEVEGTATGEAQRDATATVEAEEAAVASTATVAAQETVFAEARATGTAQSEATATARAEVAVAATASAQAATVGVSEEFLEIIEASQRLEFGPGSGNLVHQEGFISADSASVMLRDFVAEATFQNPYDITMGSWDATFLFRSSGSDDQFVLVVDSDAEWALFSRTDSDDATIETGQVPSLDTSPTGSNAIKIIALGNRGWLYVNDQPITSLELASHNHAGDIEIAIGAYGGYKIEGEETAYHDFTVWSLGTLAYGPEDGTIAHNPDDTFIEVYIADVELRDFIVEATFFNPYPRDVSAWDYGFLLRRTSDPEQRMDIIINSDATYEFRLNQEIVSSDEVSTINTAADASNTVQVITIGPEGWLYINGEFVTTLDLSSLNSPGQIMIVTGFSIGTEVAGESTGYEDFTIWSIP